ncbi:MAG: hypothetical protein Q7U54_01520 [Bacteroidales bacterium]|nr:hypothetical protein [Bacteroidales bacterium]
MLKGNYYKRFLVNLLVFLGLLFAFDRALGFILQQLYFRQVAGEYYRATYSIDSTNAEILIFGSSRASHHYVPEVLEENLHLSTYNTGRDGNYLLYNYAVIKAVTERYIPKMIILDLNPVALFYRKDDYDRLSTLLPYYGSHPEIRTIVGLRSKYERFKLYSSLYPYNSLSLSILVGNLEISKRLYVSEEGYLPFYKKMDPISISSKQTKDNPEEIYSDSIDSYKIAALQDIAEICLKKKIPLVFVFSPIYAKLNNELANNKLNTILKTYNVKYLDFSEDTTFVNHPQYFQDESHMNDDGARIFSKKLAGYLIH